MFPSNARLAKFEAVAVFNGVHVFANIMRDERLQFSDKPIEDAHFENGHEPGIFEFPNMARDGGEVMIEAGKALIRPELSFMMVPSHLCSSFA